MRFALFLGRYASFRLFSEAYKWRWSFIDFRNERFTIKRKDVNGEERFTVMPMIQYFYPFFDEILRHYNCKSYTSDSKGLDLKQIEELLKEKGNRYVAEMVKRFPRDEDFVFTEQFRARTNRRSQILKLLEKAKVDEGDWLKVTHNLRSSCEKDFVRMFGPTVAAKLCGHTIDIAYEHYLDSQEEELIRQALKIDTAESDDIKIIRDLIDRYGMKRFEELVLKAVK